MHRFVLLACAVMVLSGSCAWGDDADKKALTPEEKRLQRFWHDYHDSLRRYYESLDHIDWVAYYKSGSRINMQCGPNGCCSPINYAPVFVSPNMQWAVPYNPSFFNLRPPGTPIVEPSSPRMP